MTCVNIGTGHLADLNLWRGGSLRSRGGGDGVGEGVYASGRRSLVTSLNFVDLSFGKNTKLLAPKTGWLAVKVKVLQYFSAHAAKLELMMQRTLFSTRSCHQ